MFNIPKTLEDVKQAIILISITLCRSSKLLASDTGIIPLEIQHGYINPAEVFYGPDDLPDESYLCDSLGIAYNPSLSPPDNIPLKACPGITTIEGRELEIRAYFLQAEYIHHKPELSCTNSLVVLSRDFDPDEISYYAFQKWVSKLPAAMKKFLQGRFSPYALPSDPVRPVTLSESSAMPVEIIPPSKPEPKTQSVKRSGAGKKLWLAYLPKDVKDSEIFQKLKPTAQALYRIYRNFFDRTDGKSLYAYNRIGIVQLAVYLTLHKEDLLKSKSPAIRANAEKIRTSERSTRRAKRDLEKSGWIEEIDRGYPLCGGSPPGPKTTKYRIFKSEKQRFKMTINRKHKKTNP